MGARPAGLRITLALACALAFAVPAAASPYCDGSPVTYQAGRTVDKYVRMSVSTVPRPDVPGQPLYRPWCYFQAHSLGGFTRLPELVDKPAFVQVQFRMGRVYLKADRIGTDSFTVRHFWIDERTNRRESGLVRYHVEVHDHRL